MNCPFCGGTETHERRSWIECVGCLASGPIADSGPLVDVDSVDSVCHPEIRDSRFLWVLRIGPLNGCPPFRPCPWCGDKHPEVGSYETQDDCVMCSMCGATGPMLEGAFEDKVITLWNTRMLRRQHSDEVKTQSIKEQTND